MPKGFRTLLFAGVAASVLLGGQGFAADLPATSSKTGDAKASDSKSSDSKSGGLLGAAADLAAKVSRTAGPDVSPAQGAAAEAAVRDWLASLVGPIIKVPPQPVRMTPAGNHFALQVVFLHRDAAAGGDLVLTANAYPMDGGKWHVEDIRFNSPVVYTIDLPTHPGDDPKAPAVSRPITFTTTTTGQDGQLDFDPSFATVSTLTGNIQSLTAHAEGRGLSQDTTLGAMTSVMTIRPAGQGRVDVAMDGTLHDYRLDSTQDGAPPIHVEIGTIEAKGGMTGVSREKATAIVQMAAGMAATVFNAAKDAGGAPVPPVVPTLPSGMVPALLTALQDAASGMEFSESFGDIAVKAGEMAGGLEKFNIGMGAKSVDGILQASMDLGMEGVELPKIPMGGMEVLVPGRVALRPFLSGVAVADLLHMARVANDKQSPSPEDIMALFSHGGITSGLESLSLELGGATFRGQAKVVATAPDPSAISGTGQIVAQDFDALVAKIQAVPALAQGMPILILAKGIGRQVGNTLVWDLSYKDGKMLVNSLDLTAMAGASHPTPAPAPGPGGQLKRPPPPAGRPAR